MILPFGGISRRQSIEVRYLMRGTQHTVSFFAWLVFDYANMPKLKGGGSAPQKHGRPRVYTDKWTPNIAMKFSIEHEMEEPKAMKFNIRVIVKGERMHAQVAFLRSKPRLKPFSISQRLLDPLQSPVLLSNVL